MWSAWPGRACRRWVATDRAGLHRQTQAGRPRGTQPRVSGGDAFSLAGPITPNHVAAGRQCALSRPPCEEGMVPHTHRGVGCTHCAPVASSQPVGPKSQSSDSSESRSRRSSLLAYWRRAVTARQRAVKASPVLTPLVEAAATVVLLPVAPPPVAPALVGALVGAFVGGK